MRQFCIFTNEVGRKCL